MQLLSLAGMAVLATLSGAEDLQRQLEEKDAEIRRLRQRIQILEHSTVTASESSTKPEEQDVNRALERALVRESGLLLARGTMELEPNLVYSHFKDAETSFRRDAFGPALALRIGLPRRSQFDAELPYVFEHRREGDVSTRSSGIGDLALGLSHQWMQERTSVPGVIGAVRYQVSTGENTLFESATPVAHGSGFDAIQGLLTAVKRADPLVFFGTYSFVHHFARDRNGLEVDPGNAHGVRLGTLLAASPDTSLRALFDLTLFEKTRVNGIEVPDSDDPQALLELGASVLLSRSTALDVAIAGGLTSNAPDYRVSVALPIRF